MLSSHLPRPEIWPLTDLAQPTSNPVPARLPDKFGFIKKLATGWFFTVLSPRALV
jgi:hypothetical protein